MNKARGFSFYQYAVLITAVALAFIWVSKLGKKAMQEKIRQNMDSFSGGKLYDK